MASEPTPSSECAVFFCGTPTISASFDTFSAAAQKSAAVKAKEVVILSQISDKTKDIEYGVVVILLSNKNDLVVILNALITMKKRIDDGYLRVMVFSMLNHDKIPQLLHSKGCCETLSEELSQKALGHKLQKSIQIVTTKWKKRKEDRVEEAATPGARGKGAARGVSEKPKLKFTDAIEDENDCWLVKNKKDFKSVRGVWMGEMIGPGPAAGSWVDAPEPGENGQPLFQWVPRTATSNEFVPGNGKWYFSGRKPEFVWKSNRWLFIGTAPCLYYRSGDAASKAPKVFRFRCSDPLLLEVTTNSAVAKGKLRAMIQTFAEERTFKEEKKKKDATKDLVITQKKKSKGPRDESFAEKKKPADWGKLDSGKEEDAADWGELDSGQDEDEELGDLEAEEEISEDEDFGDLEAEDDEEDVSEDEDLDENEDEDLDLGADDDLDGNEDEDEDEDLGDLGSGGPGASKGSGKGKVKGKKSKKALRIAGDKRPKGGRGIGMASGGGSKGYAHEEEVFAKSAKQQGWKAGADAFEQIGFEISMCRLDSPGAPLVEGISLIERDREQLVLDAPASDYIAGETLSFSVQMGNGPKKKILELSCTILGSEPHDEVARVVLKVSVAETSRGFLQEIQATFDARQVQLLRFLKEAKGG